MSGSPAVSGRRVLFVCELGSPFTGSVYRTTGVGGTEACVVLLAEAWAARCAAVVVANRVPSAIDDGGVRYVPLNAVGSEPFDVIVLLKRWSDAVEGRT